MLTTEECPEMNVGTGRFSDDVEMTLSYTEYFFNNYFILGGKNDQQYCCFIRMHYFIRILVLVLPFLYF